MRSMKRTQAFRAGMVMAWEGEAATIPAGWLGEFGQVLNIADYPRLFAAVGTVHGGDGVTTFALPDSRDRVDVGAGSAYARGAKGGATTRTTSSTTLSTAQVPPHKHYAGSVDHTDGILMGYHTDTSKNGRAGGSADTKYPYTSTEGGGGSHNHGTVDVRQPYIARYKIIKY